MAAHQANNNVGEDEILNFVQNLVIYDNGHTYNDDNCGPLVDDVKRMVARHQLSMSKKGSGTLLCQQRLDFVARSLQYLASQPRNNPGKLSEELKANLVPAGNHGSCPQWFNRIKKDYEYFETVVDHDLTGQQVQGLYRTLAPKDVEICEEVKSFKGKGSAPLTDLEILRDEKYKSIRQCHHPVAPVEQLYNMLAFAHGTDHCGRDTMYSRLTTGVTKTFPKELCAEFIKLCRNGKCVEKTKGLATAVDKRNSSPRKKADTKTQKFGLKDGGVKKSTAKGKLVGQGKFAAARGLELEAQAVAGQQLFGDQQPLWDDFPFDINAEIPQGWDQQNDVNGPAGFGNFFDQGQNRPPMVPGQFFDNQLPAGFEALQGWIREHDANNQDGIQPGDDNQPQAQGQHDDLDAIFGFNLEPPVGLAFASPVQDQSQQPVDRLFDEFLDYDGWLDDRVQPSNNGN